MAPLDRSPGGPASARPAAPAPPQPTPDSRSPRYASQRRRGKAPAVAMAVVDTVGRLLAEVATLLEEALWIMTNADQRDWALDEHEQLRALEEALDEAKSDFQELGPLVNGQEYYEKDRNGISLEELRSLRDTFALHLENFQNWCRTGGPINPIWARETADLRSKLHLAQRRAARRVFSLNHDPSTRCLGALLARRKQRVLPVAAPPPPPRAASPPWHMQSTSYLGAGPTTEPDFGLEHDPHAHDAADSPSHVPLQSFPSAQHQPDDDDQAEPSQHLDEIAACNGVGHFERLGDDDIAFVCDFCTGFIVWPDLDSMPSTRTLDDLASDRGTAAEPDRTALVRPHFPYHAPYRASSSSSSFPLRLGRTSTGWSSEASGATTAAADSVQARAQARTPTWQATGFAHTTHAETRIVYAPLAIANHVAPLPGKWQARIHCPFCCDGATDGFDDDAAFAPSADQDGFEDLDALIEHLDWQHPPVSSLPVSLGLPLPSGATCAVM